MIQSLLTKLTTWANRKMQESATKVDAMCAEQDLLENNHYNTYAEADKDLTHRFRGRGYWNCIHPFGSKGPDSYTQQITIDGSPLLATCHMTYYLRANGRYNVDSVKLTYQALT